MTVTKHPFLHLFVTKSAQIPLVSFHSLPLLVYKHGLTSGSQSPDPYLFQRPLQYFPASFALIGSAVLITTNFCPSPPPVFQVGQTFQRL